MQNSIIRQSEALIPRVYGPCRETSHYKTPNRDSYSNHSFEPGGRRSPSLRYSRFPVELHSQCWIHHRNLAARSLSPLRTHIKRDDRFVNRPASGNGPHHHRQRLGAENYGGFTGATSHYNSTEPGLLGYALGCSWHALGRTHLRNDVRAAR